MKKALSILLLVVMVFNFGIVSLATEESGSEAEVEYVMEEPAIAEPVVAEAVAEEPIVIEEPVAIEAPVSVEEPVEALLPETGASVAEAEAPVIEAPVVVNLPEEVLNDEELTAEVEMTAVVTGYIEWTGDDDSEVCPEDVFVQLLADGEESDYVLDVFEDGYTYDREEYLDDDDEELDWEFKFEVPAFAANGCQIDYAVELFDEDGMLELGYAAEYEYDDYEQTWVMTLDYTAPSDPVEPAPNEELGETGETVAEEAAEADSEANTGEAAEAEAGEAVETEDSEESEEDVETNVSEAAESDDDAAASTGEADEAEAGTGETLIEMLEGEGEDETDYREEVVFVKTLMTTFTGSLSASYLARAGGGSSSSGSSGKGGKTSGTTITVSVKDLLNGSAITDPCVSARSYTVTATPTAGGTAVTGTISFSANSKTGTGSTTLSLTAGTEYNIVLTGMEGFEGYVYSYAYSDTSSSYGSVTGDTTLTMTVPSSSATVTFNNNYTRWIDWSASYQHVTITSVAYATVKVIVDGTIYSKDVTIDLESEDDIRDYITIYSSKDGYLDFYCEDIEETKGNIEDREMFSYGTSSTAITSLYSDNTLWRLVDRKGLSFGTADDPVYFTISLNNYPTTVEINGQNYTVYVNASNTTSYWGLNYCGCHPRTSSGTDSRNGTSFSYSAGDPYMNGDSFHYLSGTQKCNGILITLSGGNGETVVEGKADVALVDYIVDDDMNTLLVADGTEWVVTVRDESGSVINVNDATKVNNQKIGGGYAEKHYSLDPGTYTFTYTPTVAFDGENEGEVWKHQFSNYGCGPESSGNYTSPISRTITVEAGLKYTFEFTDVYKLGREIEYGEITVKKVWRDGGDADGERPDQIAVKLIQQIEGGEWSLFETMILDADDALDGDTWQNVFEEVPITDDEGNVYYYALYEASVTS